MNSRIRQKCLEYLVDWKGYGPKERTWEPAKQVKLHAKEAIAKFHQLNPNKPK
jgi:hypothetical protein